MANAMSGLVAAGSRYPAADPHHLPIGLVLMVLAGLAFGVVLRLVTTVAGRPGRAGARTGGCATCTRGSCPAAGLAGATETAPRAGLND